MKPLKTVQTHYGKMNSCLAVWNRFRSSPFTSRLGCCLIQIYIYTYYLVRFYFPQSFTFMIPFSPLLLYSSSPSPKTISYTPALSRDKRRGGAGVCVGGEPPKIPHSTFAIIRFLSIGNWRAVYTHVYIYVR